MVSTPDAGQVRWRSARLFLVGVGAAFLAVAIAVGSYGSIIDTGPVCHGSCDLRAVSIVLWACTGVAAIVLVWAMAAIRLRPIGLGVACFALTIVGLVAGGLDLPTSLNPWYEVEPLSPQQAWLTVTYWLAIAGTFAVGLGSAALDGRGTKLVCRAGAVVGLVVAVASTSVTWWSALGAHPLDATTSAVADVPAVPQTLGARTFRVSLGQLAPTESSTLLHPYGAGTGFVTWREDRNDVTAYDASGAERWHYRRSQSSALTITAVHVYDGGRTVAMALAPPNARSDDPRTLVGLDAVTGEQLWAATGDDLVDAFFSGRSGVQSPFLVARSQDQWAAFDTRTGKATWRIPSPTPCGHVRTVDTSTTVVVVEQCLDEKKVVSTFRVVAVDPTNGTVLFTKELIRRAHVSPDTTAQPAGATGATVRVSWSAPDPADGAHRDAADQLYVDGVSGAVTDLGLDRVEASTWPDGGFLIVGGEGRDPRRTLHSSGDDRGCDVPREFPSISDWESGRAGAGWLGRQLVGRASAGESAIVALDRATCAIARVEPVPGLVTQVVAAPGALVALVVESGEMYAYGFAQD